MGFLTTVFVSGLGFIIGFGVGRKLPNNKANEYLRVANAELQQRYQLLQQRFEKLAKKNITVVNSDR